MYTWLGYSHNTIFNKQYFDSNYRIIKYESVTQKITFPQSVKRELLSML